jgi:hypothetical protein
VVDRALRCDSVTSLEEVADLKSIVLTNLISPCRFTPLSPTR